MRYIPIAGRRFWQKPSYWCCPLAFELRIQLQPERPVFALLECRLVAQNPASDALLLRLFQRIRAVQQAESLTIDWTELGIGYYHTDVELQPGMDKQQLINRLNPALQRLMAQLPQNCGIQFCQVKGLLHQRSLTDDKAPLQTRLKVAVKALEAGLEGALESALEGHGAAQLQIDELYQANRHLMLNLVCTAENESRLRHLMVKIQTLNHVLQRGDCEQSDIDTLLAQYRCLTSQSGAYHD